MRVSFIAAISAIVLLGGCSEISRTSTETAPVSETNEPGCCATTTSEPETIVRGTGDRVFFEVDKYDLDDAARQQILKWVDFLKKYPDDQMLIEGHADERGTREYNLALGARRAYAVEKFMISMGVPASQLKMTSFGKERPSVFGSNEQAWAQNRRVVVVLQ